MIKNIIIISLLLVIVFNVSGEQFLDYIQLALDKTQELVYTIKSEVKK
tara:strand:+ start:1302 stop:1445 length:144 start_codon:yes stop_codon:yes gene_type:complete